MTILDRTPLYQGHLGVQKLRLRDDSGKELVREVIVRRDAVAALVYDRDQQAYLLVEQWRPGAEGPLRELPAGIIDEGEAPEVALRRELEEELGVVVGETTRIATFYSTPGFCTEQIHLYYAEVTGRVGEGGGKAEEDEQITIRPVKADDFYAAPPNDAKTAVAWAWARGQLLNTLSR